MPSAIDMLVDQAQKAADAAPPPVNTPVALTGETLPASNYGTGARLPTLGEAADTARVAVDYYLQVMKDGSGLKIGKDMGFPVDEFFGTVDMTQVKTNFVIRVDNGSGQQAKYVKSLNMITTTAGVPLDAAIKQVLLPGGKVKDPYVSYLIPVVLTEDIVDAKKGSTFVAKAGQTVGIETSFSAAMDFATFLAKLKRIGLLDATIKVVVKNKSIRSGGGIDYGSFEMDIVPEPS